MRIKGKGPLLDTPPLPVTTLPVRTRFVRHDGGGCWESVHSTPTVNGPEQFTAKSD